MDELIFRIMPDNQVYVTLEIVEGADKMQLKDNKLHVAEIDESGNDVRLIAGKLYANVFDETGIVVIIQYTVNYSSGGNGSLSATVASGSKVDEGTQVTFTASPSAGYQIKSWTVNGTIVNGTNSSYTTTVTSDITVSITYEAIPVQTSFKVTFSAGSNGSISAKANGTTISSGSQVNAGSTVVFTASPNNQYIVNGWTLNGASVNGTNTTYTINDLSQDITVNVTFVRSCYLTTTMVEHYGLEDDGAELTAMRKLRKQYAIKHAEILSEYYVASAVIIDRINSSNNPEFYYQKIRNTVDFIVALVDNEEWSEAEELYLNLYFDLKNEFKIE